MFDLPSDLHPDLVPLSWVLGVWEGTGVIDYEADGRHFSGEFAHRVSFSHDGGAYLNYTGHAWLEGEDASRAALVSETGYWRLARPALDSEPGPGLLTAPAAPAVRTADDVEVLRNAAGGFDIEALIVHSDGVSEIYLGQVSGPRVDISTDFVVRTAGARAYTAASRMYGLVEGHLLWAWDIAALGGELASHASARLAKVQ